MMAAYDSTSTNMAGHQLPMLLPLLLNTSISTWCARQMSRTLCFGTVLKHFLNVNVAYKRALPARKFQKGEQSEQYAPTVPAIKHGTIRMNNTEIKGVKGVEAWRSAIVKMVSKKRFRYCFDSQVRSEEEKQTEYMLFGSC